MICQRSLFNTAGLLLSSVIWTKPLIILHTCLNLLTFSIFLTKPSTISFMLLAGLVRSFDYYEKISKYYGNAVKYGIWKSMKVRTLVINIMFTKSRRVHNCIIISIVDFFCFIYLQCDHRDTCSTFFLVFSVIELINENTLRKDNKDDRPNLNNFLCCVHS